MSSAPVYSDPDQPARFAQAKADQNQRYLDITTVYDSSFLKGKRVAITGANRGIGLALATELVEAGGQLIAIVRSSSPELEALKPVEIVQGIDVTNDAQCESIASQITGGPVDIVRTIACVCVDCGSCEETKRLCVCICGDASSPIRAATPPALCHTHVARTTPLSTTVCGSWI